MYDIQNSITTSVSDSLQKRSFLELEDIILKWMDKKHLVRHADLSHNLQFGNNSCVNSWKSL